MGIYVGHIVNGSQNTDEVFNFPHNPTHEDGLPYNSITGPFRTVRAAKYLVNYGRGNPHATTVSDCERSSKSLEDRGEVDFRKLPKKKEWTQEAYNRLSLTGVP